MCNLIEYKNNYLKLPEVYGNTIEMNYLQIIMIMLLILAVLIIKLNFLKINKELTGQPGATSRKSVKMLIIKAFH